MKFIKLLKITDAITFLNITIAMLAMIGAITGKTGVAAQISQAKGVRPLSLVIEQTAMP